MSREALVVGINSYPLKKKLNLKKAVADAVAIAQMLRDHGGFHVRLVLAPDKADRSPPVDRGLICNIQPNRKGLEKEIEGLFKPPSNIPGEGNDTALLFFAGHGFVQGGKKGFLATSDADGEYTWGVSFNWLRQLLLDSPVRQKLVWLDCCHSGALLKFDEQNLDTLNFAQDICLIAASRSFEPAYEHPDSKNGVLTEALLAALEPTDEKPWVTSIDLVAYVQERLKNERQRPCHRNFNKEIFITGKEKISEVTLKDTCPYQGLKPFDVGDADNFSGRDDLVTKLLEGLKNDNFLAVLGASGSGKSSAVKAGLVHQLQKKQGLPGSDKWKIVIFRPGENPLESLARKFGEDPNNFDLARFVGDSSVPVLVVVDQFEEVFTLCQEPKKRQWSPGDEAVLVKKLSPEEKAQMKRPPKLRDQFMTCLLGALDRSDSNLKVVITMRADFLGHCAEYDYSGLAKKIEDHLVLVGPMNENELRQAIEQPAKNAHAQVDPLLVDRMLSEVQGPGSLPLLQYTLWVMWNNPSQYRLLANSLVLSDYQQLGGVKGTLSTRADEVYEQLDGQQKSAARWIFMNLTRLGLGEGASDTRKQVLKSALVNQAYPQTIIDETVRQLADARLLVTSEKGGETTVDVAHEALIRNWDKLRGWVNKNRRALIFKDEIEKNVQEWLRNEKSDDHLLSPGKLDEAESYLQQYADWGWLSDDVKEYIPRSRERQKEQVTLPQMRADAAVVQNLLNVDPVNSMVLAIKAAGDNLGLERSKGELEHYVQSSLLDAIIKVRETNIFKGHSDDVYSVAFSPDGKRIVSGGRDKTIRLWDTDGNAIGKPFRGHYDYVRSVAFSPDGKRIVSGGQGNTIRFWDLEGNPIGEPFRGHRFSVWSVAFSPDGKRIVSGGDDNTIKLWDLEGNPIGEPFRGHEDDVRSVAFSPDGKRIVSGSDDKTIRLWDTDGNPIGEPFRGHEDDVRSVAFSPDGKRIVSGSNDKTIRLWDLDGNPIGEPFRSHDDPLVSSVAFSPDGKRIVSGNSDKTIRLWDLDGNPIGKPFRGHENSVESVAFSPDGKRIVSGSYDNTIRLWDLDVNPIGEPFRGHTNSVSSVAFSPDGKRILSGSYDKTIRLWDLKGNPIGEPFRGHKGSVNSVAFSPDGKRIVSGSEDKTIRLWDLDGNPIGEPFTIGEPFRVHKDSVESVAFSPDGKRIVSHSRDKTIRLWDLDGNTIGEPFKGHDSYVSSVAFSPDGKRIVSGSSDKTIRLWDLKGNPIGEPFRGHKDSVYSVAFSPDGKRIVSGSNDKTIRLWDLDGNTIGEPFKGHENGVNSVAFSPDGKWIVSSSNDKTIRLWRGGGCWLTVACDKLQFHPVLAGPDISTNAQFAVEACRKYVWDDKGKARFLMRQGWLWLEKQDFPGALAKFEEAHRLDANIDLNAAKKLVVDPVISTGLSLASKGDVSGALVKFEEAHHLDDTVDVLALEEEAKKRAKSFEASKMVAKGKKLAKHGKVKEALAVYAEAQQIELEISAKDWNYLCLYGSLHGEGASVINACDRAVALSQEDGKYGSSLYGRGIARALTGDTAGAIADLEADVKWLEDTFDKKEWDEYKKECQGWIEVLRTGENPFTEELLEQLRRGQK